MSTALVTGAAGFLGSHVADRLIQMGMSVVILDDFSGGFWRNVPAHCELCVGSIEDRLLVNRLFHRHRFQYVYHLAAYAAEGLSHYIRHFNYRINLLGSINLINAAVNYGTECFVFTSSAAVYGSGVAPFAEDSPPHPEDPYGISKLAVESDLRAAAAMWGMRYVIFRPHNVYGERQNLADPFRNVIAIFMNQVLSGCPCTIFGDGTQSRGFSYVDDVAPIIAESVKIPGAQNQVLNIGTNETCSLNQLAQMVQNALGMQVGVHILPPRPEPQHVTCDHKRVNQVFNRTPIVALKDGIARMAAWARTIKIGEPRPVTRLNVCRGLPPSWAHRLLGPNQGIRT
jgi:UDP-glucose 4-epimerase